jgi:hypothetical protein
VSSPSSASTLPAEALRALAAVLAPYLVPHLSGAATRPFSQRDGERPPGAGRAKYLRTWRRARDAEDTGAWSEGRARLMSPEAWGRWSRFASRHAPVKVAPSAPTLLDELGAKRVAA